MGISQNEANRAAGPLTAPAGPIGGKYRIPANHPFNYFVASGTNIRWAPGCFDTVVGNEGGTCVPVAVTTRDQLRPLGQSVSGRKAPDDSIFTNDPQRYLLGLNADYGRWTIGLWAQQHARRQFGRPKRTILHGQSYGGNVVAKLAELDALDTLGQPKYDGMLLTSAAVGKRIETYNKLVNTRVVYQFFAVICHCQMKPNIPRGKDCPNKPTLHGQICGAV
jgi:hypothetical protein